MFVVAQHKGQQPLDPVVGLAVLLHTQLLCVARTLLLAMLAGPAAIFLQGQQYMYSTTAARYTLRGLLAF
jgi:hypothetical protein